MIHPPHTIRRRTRWATILLVWLVVCVQLSTRTAQAAETVLTEDLVQNLLKDENGALLEEQGRYVFLGLKLQPERAGVLFRLGEKGKLVIYLVPKNDLWKASHTKTGQVCFESKSFYIWYPVHPSHRKVGEKNVKAALDAIIGRIQVNDPGDLVLSLAPPVVKRLEAADTAWQGTPPESKGGDNPVAPEADGAEWESNDESEAGWYGAPPGGEGHKNKYLLFGFILLAFALLGLPLLCWLAWKALREFRRPIRLSLAGTIATGAVLRLLVIPHIVVTMYMGYLLTDQAANLDDIFRYGFGAQVLWNSLFHIAPVDHSSIIALNAVLGTFNLLFWAAILCRAGLRPLGVLFATIILAFLPMVLWSDGSDSLTVPVLFWTLGATLFAQEYLRSKRILYLLGAILWLSMAAHTRPEQVLFGPLLLFTILATQNGPRSLLARLKAPIYAWIMAFVGYLLLIWPQLRLMMDRRNELIALKSWPHELGDILPNLPYLLSTRNALIRSELMPQLILPLALVSILVARNWPTRRFRLGILTVGFVWMVFYYIDLSSASLPRLHIVLAIPCCIATADLLADLWHWHPPKVGWLGRVLTVTAFGVLAAQTPATARWLWQDTNEWQEDRMFRDALAQIPDEKFQLVYFSYQDPETVCMVHEYSNKKECSPGYVHEHNPDYLAEPPVRAGRVFSINRFIDQGTLTMPTYYYQGMRCYSQLRPDYAPAPKTYYSPACAAFENSYNLEPILERDYPNRGDLALHYYSREKSFHLGLYRVRSKK